MEHTLTKANFDEIVLKSEEPILVDFWASWCGPCMMLAPFVEELSKTRKVGKVNVDEEPELARQFNIMSIPTLLVFKGGKLVNQSMGYQSLESLQALMEV
ncbi:MAG: thioredoxin [Oscillospiraceae bacterium]|nr:thioredoxin [Oscillospiraceae bacterium]